MTTIQLAKKLPDSNDDNVVKVSKAGAKKYGLPKTGNWYGPIPGEPDFTYSDVKPGAAPTPSPAPTPAPPPPPPPPAPEPTPAPTPAPPPAGTVPMSAMRLGEVFLQTADITVGINEWGGFGTTKNAPTGYRTDAEHGFLRVGIYVPGLTDITLPGRAIEGPGWVINGKRHANMLLQGYYEMPGAFVDALTWAGEASGLKSVERFSITGRTIRIEMTDTNVSNAPIDLVAFRSIDPDQTDKFVTTNKVSAPGIMECGLPGKVGTLIFRAAGASFCYADYSKSQDIGTPQAVGVTRAKDETVQAVWPSVRLAPGESVTRVVEYEVVKA